MRRRRGRFQRTNQGAYRVELPPEERRVLRSIAEQLRQLVSVDDDPDLVRLYPPAYAEHPEYDAEFHQLMRGDLRDGRLAAIAMLEETVDAAELSEEQLLAWMRVANDARLVLGTKLEVSEELDIDEIDDDDPNAPGYAIYSYLSMVVDQIVGALNR